jgi:small subunit ribosomal protein S5
MAYEKQEWHPVTGLGKLVASGEIKSIDQVLESGRPIKEPEIVDAFLPDLEDEVLDIAMMQRMTDSGRRVQFRAVILDLARARMSRSAMRSRRQSSRQR